MESSQEYMRLSQERLEFEDQVAGYESAIFDLNTVVQNQTLPLERRRESMQLLGYYTQVLSEKNEILSDIRISLFKLQQSYKQYQETIHKVQAHRGHQYPILTRKQNNIPTKELPEPELKELTILVGNKKKIF